MPPLVSENEIVNLRNEVRDLEQQAEAKQAAADKLVEDIRGAGTDPLKDAAAFEKIDAAYKEGDGLREQAIQLRARLERALEIAGKKRDTEPRKTGDDGAETIVVPGLAIAKRFIESDVYETLKASGALKMAGARVSSDPVEVLTREEFVELIRRRATVSWPAAVPLDQRPFPPVEFPVRRIRVLDLITVSTTDADTVEWVEETTRTDVAAETAFGTAAPEATYVYTKKSTTVKRIPQFTPATKGNLADSGQLQSLLENRLQNGVMRRIESQALAGDGAGENLRGIYNTVGIGSIALGADTRLDALHKAITTVRLAFFDEPTAIGMHPNDGQQVILEKDADGNYVLGPAAMQAVNTIWGFPLVQSTAFTENKPLVGAYPEAELPIREGVNVAASDSHSDFFIKGLVALLAEVRAAFLVRQPKAFCEITGF